MQVWPFPASVSDAYPRIVVAAILRSTSVVIAVAATLVVTADHIEPEVAASNAAAGTVGPGFAIEMDGVRAWMQVGHQKRLLPGEPVAPNPAIERDGTIAFLQTGATTGPQSAAPEAAEPAEPASSTHSPSAPPPKNDRSQLTPASR